MPRQKKVAEVPVETINAIGQALSSASEALNGMSYAQVKSLASEAQVSIEGAATGIHLAVRVFERLYINRPKQSQPAPRKNTLKPLRKPKVQQVLENHEE